MLEVQLTTAGLDSDDGRADVHFVQLGAVVAIGDYHSGMGLLKPVLDGLGAERGEQGLVNRPEAPGSEDGHQQFGGARHQAGNPVACAYPLRL